MTTPDHRDRRRPGPPSEGRRCPGPPSEGRATSRRERTRAGTGVAGLVVVAAAATTAAGCTADGVALPVLGGDARSTVEVKRDLNASVADVVGTLTAHEAGAHRTLEVGGDYGPCPDDEDRVGYDFGAIWLESPEFSRNWTTLEPRVVAAAERHGYARVDPAASGVAVAGAGGAAGGGVGAGTGEQRTVVFANADADRVEVAVTPTGVGTSAGSGCFTPAD